jgi:hypothetical protein
MNQDRFTYTEYRLLPDRQTVEFVYTVNHDGTDYGLTEALTFPTLLKNTPEQRRSLRALHLALGVSYYKIFLPPVMVHPYAMDQAEANFWNNIWRNGLGEFLYVNQLSADQIAQFTPQDGERFEGETGAATRGALLGIGGGKDSIVAGELLKTLSVPLEGFVMATGEQLGQAGLVSETMGIPLNTVKRELDTQLLSLQEDAGAYKGHVPISLIFGLVGIALAIAKDKSYVVVANEASASIPRIEWNGQAINHQWSKSFDFEKDLQAFIHTDIIGSVTYFSAIRPLTSIGVAKLFAGFPRYFEVFTSDNFVFRINPAKRPIGRWSLESPKSLSSYILLSPWLGDEDIHRIFTYDFLNETSLSKLFLELIGVEGEPPLDCVGTVEEIVVSLNLLAYSGRFHDTALMQLGRDAGVVRDGDWRAETNKLLELQPDEVIPTELHEQILSYLQGQVQA